MRSLSRKCLQEFTCPLSTRAHAANVFVAFLEYSGGRNATKVSPDEIAFNSTVSVFFSEPEPKDHVAENIRRMRRIQRESKKKQAEAPQPVPVKALWKSSKYEAVPSKVKDFMIEVRNRSVLRTVFTEETSTLRRLACAPPSTL